MADSKLEDLTADATPGTDSLLYTVDDPGGTPVDRKVTLANLLGTDLASIRALTTTAYGRALLTLADQAALQAAVNVEDGATADQSAAEIKTAYESNADTNAFTDDEQSKLSGIEALADVTDATNVDAAGAIMESDISGTVVGTSDTQTLTNKTLDSFTNDIEADAVHIQVRNESGVLLQKGTPVYISGYSVGQDVVLVDDADATSSATMPCIGLLQDDIDTNATGACLVNGRISGVNTGSFSAGDLLYVSETAGALTSTRPTGTAIVQVVGEVLRSHASLGVIDIDRSRTTQTGFIATLLDDGSADDARTTLGVDAAGTDNSTDVTLAGTPDYLTIAGQVITRNQIDLTTDVTGDLPVTEGGTGASDASGARTNLSVYSQAETDSAIDTDVATHNSDTTSVHGIADTSALLTDSDVIDDDSMATASATTVPTSESTKAYVDTEIADLPEAGYGISTARTGFLDVQAFEVDEFTSSGTLTKPDGARFARCILIGAGGGGASGYRNAEGNLRVGGGGGAPGAHIDVVIDASDLDATEAVTIGTGGAGGAGLTATTGPGNPGSAGGDTIIDTISGSLTAAGGAGATHSSGFTPGYGARGAGGRGGFALNTSGLDVGVAFTTVCGVAGGGGAGATRTAANTNLVAGDGGGSDSATGGANQNPGGAGSAGTGENRGGGGGGGTIGTGNGSVDGGDGGTPGGGGGGGSFGNTAGGGADTNSGDGGDGGDGYAKVIWYR